MTEIVLFGITGDLSRQKLIPALFNIFLNGEISSRSSFFGFGRKSFKKEEFSAFIEECIMAKYSGKLIDIQTKQKLSNFCNQWSYICSEITDTTGYITLASKLKKPGSYGTNDSSLIYISLPPSLQLDVVQRLISQNVITRGSINDQSSVPNVSDNISNPIVIKRRLAIEKPYGHDSISSKKLEHFLMKNLDDDQIIRVDHYAGKQALVELEATARQGIFSRVLNSAIISKIELRLKETLDVSMRGNFYDGVGALNDIFQNHILHMLGTVLVLPSFAAGSVSTQRSKAIRLLKVKTSPKYSIPVLGQYVDYTSTKGVAPDSKTETFFNLHLTLENPSQILKHNKGALGIKNLSKKDLLVSQEIYNQWKGVEIQVIGGKALDVSDASITLFPKNLKNETSKGKTKTKGQSRNQNTSQNILEPIKILVNGYGKRDAYETIFHDAVIYNPDRFIDFDQILAGWNLAESIKQHKIKRIVYQKGAHLG